MATLVAFHAHPDDECIMQSGSLSRAVDAGHRVVIVYATDGRLGQVPDGLLAPGETLAERRRQEAARSAEVIGVHRVVWLGYGDSGMQGEPGNDDPACFWRAGVDEAAGRLADVLRDEGADVLTIYDRNGNYGHPDHVQVHRVGGRAAELAGTAQVLELTISRDHIRTLMAGLRESGEPGESGGPGAVDLDDPEVTLGMPDADITTRVEVGRWLDRKRASMEAHASQVGDTGPFLAMPPELFRAALGVEFYIRRGVAPGHRDDDIFAGVRSGATPAAPPPPPRTVPS